MPHSRRCHHEIGGGNAYCRRTAKGRNMVEHTPGPWEFHHQKMDSIDYEWSLQTPTHAFLLFDFSPILSLDECKANASLIAAAPDLLEVLRLFDTFAWTAVKADCIESLNELNRRITLARAAIAKARGTSGSSTEAASDG